MVLSKKCTSMTQVKIQFCLLGTIFTTKFAKIKDREIAPFEHWFEFCRLFNKRFRECKQTLSVLDEVRVRWSCDKTNSTKLFWLVKIKSATLVICVIYTPLHFWMNSVQEWSRACLLAFCRNFSLRLKVWYLKVYF